MSNQIRRSSDTGELIHRTIISTGIETGPMHQVEYLAKDLGLTPVIIRSRANGIITLVLPPDGHKVGWPGGDQADDARDKVKQLLESLHMDWFEVEYGEVPTMLIDGHHQRSLADQEWRLRTRLLGM